MLNDEGKYNLLPHTLAKLRHLYANLVGGGVNSLESASSIARGLLGPVIESLERQVLAGASDREQFEKHWENEEPRGRLLLNCKDGVYEDSGVQRAWRAWQARSAFSSVQLLQSPSGAYAKQGKYWICFDSLEQANIGLAALAALDTALAEASAWLHSVHPKSFGLMEMLDRIDAAIANYREVNHE